MAARKSCTHLTWAEAKNKSGIGGSGGKAKQPPQRENHGKLLAAKIVAKQGPSETEQIKNRQAARRARRDQQYQEALDAQREAEKEQRRLEAVAKPNDQAIARLAELALEFRSKGPSEASLSFDDSKLDPTNKEDWPMICECKQLQLDEMMALEAIYVTEDVDDEPDGGEEKSGTLMVAESCRLEDLRNKDEERQMGDPDSEEAQRPVVEHPPVSFVLKYSVEDPGDDDWVAHLLVEVAFPPDYPLETTPPRIGVSWFLLTQKSLVVADNKPLETWGHLDQDGLMRAMTEHAGAELLGLPSVYELLDTWLSEHLFEFVTRTTSPTTPMA